MQTTDDLDRRLLPLDGLRGIAILAVLLLHFWGLPFAIAGDQVSRWPDEAAERLAYPGWAGVELFFVLSGFLITRILLDTKGRERYFSTFYLRRALRIIPPYYLFLAFSIGVLPHLDLATSAAAREIRDDQAWLWTYTLNVAFSFQDTGASVPAEFIHLWSLAFEEQFYLVWPFVVLLFSRRNLAALCTALFVGSFAFRIFLVSDAADSVFAPSAPRQLVPAHCDALAAGALLAVLAGEGRMQAVRRPLVVAGMASAAVLAALFLWRDGLPLHDGYVQTAGFALISMACAGMLGAVLTCRSGDTLHRALTTPLLVSFGRYSYVMYLIHVPIGFEIADMAVRRDVLFTAGGVQMPANAVFTLVAMTVTFGLGWLSWQFFESRVLALKNRLPYAREERAPAATPSTAQA